VDETQPHHGGVTCRSGASQLAASIFRDVLNVFLRFLNLFNRN